MVQKKKGGTEKEKEEGNSKATVKLAAGQKCSRNSRKLMGRHSRFPPFQERGMSTSSRQDSWQHQFVGRSLEFSKLLYEYVCTVLTETGHSKTKPMGWIWSPTNPSPCMNEAHHSTRGVCHCRHGSPPMFAPPSCFHVLMPQWGLYQDFLADTAGQSERWGWKMGCDNGNFP